MKNISRGQKMLVNKRGAFDWGHRGIRAGDKVITIDEPFGLSKQVEVEFLEIKHYHDLHWGSTGRGSGVVNRFFLKMEHLEMKEEYETI